MDILENVSRITIRHTSLSDLLAKTTKNPLAEEELPAMLKDAILKGIEVIITDDGGVKNYRLVWDGKRFSLSPL